MIKLMVLVALVAAVFAQPPNFAGTYNRDNSAEGAVEAFVTADGEYLGLEGFYGSDAYELSQLVRLEYETQAPDSTGYWPVTVRLLHGELTPLSDDFKELLEEVFAAQCPEGNLQFTEDRPTAIPKQCTVCGSEFAYEYLDVSADGRTARLSGSVCTKAERQPVFTGEDAESYTRVGTQETFSTIGSVTVPSVPSPSSAGAAVVVPLLMVVVVALFTTIL
eukprot:TRINITY_DN25378_c0_g1_i1.p1 TRINITY_DN25378_c0_g1~~TRINITY_DN25378_c0_g1_i1.p1  ORF type:complete len:229 (-),score=25.57 TRINITY_DN25378_c0_g1_i1:95-754(-)